MKRRTLLSTALTPFIAQSLSACVGLKTDSGSLPAISRIAFGSCINEEDPQAIWQPILASRPDLFIFGGDNVYSSKVPFSLSELKTAYEKLDSNPGFKTLRATVPHIATWDDNDYGLNDGGAAFEHRAESKQVFLDFWKIAANDERRHREGIYQSFSYGPTGRRVQVILLDGRSFLSPWKVTDQRGAPGKERYVPDIDPAKTILGAAQWAWLERQLTQPADVRLIVSGIQVLADGHGWERWGNFPNERLKLFDLIIKTRANGVVFLSGDRHIGAFYQQPTEIEGRKLAYPLTEMTSSGMTHTWKTANEVGPNRLGDLVTQLHFGMVEIDWVTKNVALQLRGIHGDLLRELKVQSI